MALTVGLTATDEKATKTDFIGYWAAGQQMVRGESLYGESLYDEKAVLVLVLWSVWRRAPRVLAGLVVAVLLSNFVVLFFDPHVWSQYQAMMTATGLNARFAPTLAAELRLHLSPRTVWLQYLPVAAACLWASWYYWTRRNRWDWLDQGMAVLLVSVLVAPYAWVTDELVLLPAVLAGMYAATETRRSLMPIAVMGIAALIELFADVRITAWYYLWTAPAWLAWFVYATRARVAPARRAAALNVS